jgi:aspartyl-tRNA(Asn)/glutamyl-tRNA(Gln) amidotransferase subunit A
MGAVLERAERVQPLLNCFIRIDTRAALQAASDADRDLARGHVRGPLHGVPMAHKDMFYRKGVASSCGSRIKRDVLATSNATVLERLDAAGALQFGVLNMAEFAYGPTGHNSHFGHCRNPWNPQYITGGSSSGSGASLAARANFAALGSDTGGSIRLPASLCGTAGIKPTYGRVSRAGAMPLSFSVDTVGPLARTVEDCALILGVIAGADPADATASGRPVPDYQARLGRSPREAMRGVRIGTSRAFYPADIDPGIDAAMQASLDVFRSLGAEIVEIELPADFDAWQTPTTLVIASEAAAVHGNWMRTRPQDYSQQVLARLEAGRAIPAPAYIDALRFRADAIERFVSAVFGRVDVLHAPVVDIRTPTIAESDVGGSAAMAPTIARVTRLTRPFNYLGLPALAVQAGFAAAGSPGAFLPVGMQLIGRPFDEATLFAVGHAFQQATQWHEQTAG